MQARLLENYREEALRQEECGMEPMLRKKRKIMEKKDEENVKSRRAKNRREICACKEKSDEKNRKHMEELNLKYDITEDLRKISGSYENELSQMQEMDRKHFRRACEKKKRMKQVDSITQMEKGKVGFTIKTTSIRNEKWFVMKETDAPLFKER
ncbi:hypothetical protein NPIL_156091 [Nephila pilipes]|uniref:Uncharacterized protein n=1 Tax=Nephila pilipes TaxID=299642 RepID=A0A8X6TZ85_NEPPI|nr:hypothetical protein NPIL_156091 [Nephila pilipes]